MNNTFRRKEKTKSKIINTGAERSGGKGGVWRNLGRILQQQHKVARAKSA